MKRVNKNVIWEGWKNLVNFIGFFVGAEFFVEEWRNSEDKLYFESNFTVVRLEIIFEGVFYAKKRNFKRET